MPLLAPLVRQELGNLVAALEEMISVPPDRVWCVGELDLVRIPVLLSEVEQNSKSIRIHETYWVFQASCPALTLIFAVSSVKGGNGALDSAILIIIS